MAVENDNILTFEEYSKALNIEYKKLGYDLNIVENEDGIVYTTELLAKQIAYARDNFRPVTVTCTSREVRIDKSNSILNGPAPRVMPIDFHYTAEYRVTSGKLSVPSYSDYTFECIGTVDYQSGNVMDVRACDVFKTFSINMDEDNSYARYNILSNQDIAVSVLGSISFAWTDPFTNSTFQGVNYGPFFTDTFDPENY